MAYGEDTSWVASAPDVAGAGALEAARMGWGDTGRAMTGGDWANAAQAAGLSQPDSGLVASWAEDAGSSSDGAQPVGAGVRAKLTDWRTLFDPSAPTFWLLVGLLIAVGLIHLRVNTRVGPAHGSFGLG